MRTKKKTKKTKKKKKTMEKNKTAEKVEKMIELMGFSKETTKVSIDEEHNKISIHIDDEAVRGETSPQILSALHHLLNQMLRKESGPYYVVDLNYYRKERERLIIELARTAARKATVTGEEVRLPPMNSYERRIVHVELKAHPSLSTESEGGGKERLVVIKKITDN